jgi:hypothetical protein
MESKASESRQKILFLVLPVIKEIPFPEIKDQKRKQLDVGGRQMRALGTAFHLVSQ